MKIFYLFCFSVVLLSCQSINTPRTFNSIEINEIKRDSTSIRAIYAIDSNTLAYVGSRGDFSLTKDGGKTWEDKLITYQDSIAPHFRSLAYNGKDFFALSVSNPALLYQISNDKTTLVYQENHEKVFYDSMHFFADNIHGIAVGDPTSNCASILLTHDAGATWQKVPCDNLPTFEEGEAFFAASNTNITIIGSTVWIASGGSKARVLKSNDYGVSWEVYDTPIIQGDGPQGIYSIDFYDDKRGIIMGGNFSKPNENSRNKAITVNGGETWEVVADGLNPDYKSCVQYVPESDGMEVFAVGKTGISFSNDGGLNWKTVSEESYYSIQFVDRNTAWLSGEEKIGRLNLK